MRTTVRLDDGLLARAKREATRRGITLTALIEQALQSILASSSKPGTQPQVDLPVCRAGGGAQPGVDLNNSAELFDRMDGRI